MGSIKKFTDLDAWKESHKLTLLIYRITELLPKSEDFGLKSQIRRASVSVESCIAGGFSRFHYKDRINFFYDSRGSLSEVQNQILIAKDLDFIKISDFNKVIYQIEKTASILGGLIRSTKSLSKKFLISNIDYQISEK